MARLWIPTCAAVTQRLGSGADCNRAELPAVVSFAAVRCAPVAVESLRVRIGVAREPLDVADARSDKARRNIGFEIEVRLASRAIHEEPGILGAMVDEARVKLLIDFVRALADARADCSADVAAARPKPLHCSDRCIRDSRKCAAPSRVRGSDNGSAVVAEQHWRAISSEDPEKQVRTIGDECIRSGPLLLGPDMIGKDDVGGVDLVHRRKLRTGQKGRDCPAAILVDRRAIVVAPETDVQSLELAARNSSHAAKKPVRNRAER